MAGELVFPDVVPVDSTKRAEAVFVSMDQTLYTPDGIATSFDRVNDHYTADRTARLRFMADSVFAFDVPGTLGIQARIHASLEHDDRNTNSSDLLVVTSPLNDGPPETSAEVMARYVANHEPTRAEINEAKPNAWSPATKLDTGYEFINVEGLEMPVLQIFSRVPPRALTVGERARLLGAGDHAGYGRIALEGVRQADRMLREAGGDGIRRVHFFGSGLAHNAIAAARYFAGEQNQYEPSSFTAMNLILGEKLSTMGADYSVRQHTGEAAKIILPPGYRRIAEPIMRQEIDGKGAEGAMRGRQLRAIADLTYTLSLPRSKHTAKTIEELMDLGVPGTIANAYNGSMTANTRHFLPVGEAGLHLVDIVGVEGKKVGMMSNEQASLVALLMGVGLRNGGLEATR
ncbi:MAG TPA: hypothetical protein VFC50_00310 [Candidatus Dormibacteraeota bacterium]|nr:hypothetical protein [Candidatus Dormibacteraeota bacterium]